MLLWIGQEEPDPVKNGWVILKDQGLFDKGNSRCVLVPWAAKMPTPGFLLFREPANQELSCCLMEEVNSFIHNSDKKTINIPSGESNYTVGCKKFAPMLP
jgi:hypothetical protein